MNTIEGVIFDWAGTTVDFGCFAPVSAFMKAFQAAGVEVTVAEARAPMGLLKKDHIRAMLTMPRVGREWEKQYGRSFQEEDIEALYAQFEPLLLGSLAEFTEPLPGVLQTVDAIRGKGLKIGSTTGYTDNMMAIVTQGAKAKGYEPDCWVSPDATGCCGRPYPYMIFRNMETLKLSAPWRVVKVGDTAADIQEGLQAGVWSVGVCTGSSQMGLSRREFELLSDKAPVIEQTRQAFLNYGAHFVLEAVSELPALIEHINRLFTAGKRPYDTHD
ncbi:phosphonoacetaldehyde hydrolase [Sporomusa aerivorans]|uniref:phosphonoacetaldehyde hydrolase n=1 Tax=Sporomusa aerivorans TaxID=204936 RepID=UPI003529DEF8